MKKLLEYIATAKPVTDSKSLQGKKIIIHLN